MITVRGKELDFNFFNPEDVKRLSEARKAVREKYASLAEKNKANDLDDWADMLAESIQVIFSMFDSVFGEGTANEIFGEHCSFDECIDAYNEFENQIARQNEGIYKRMAVKYAPEGTDIQKKGKAKKQ